MSKLGLLFLFFCTSSSLLGFYSGNPAFFAVPCEGPVCTKEGWLALKLGALVDGGYERRLKGKGRHQGVTHVAAGGMVSALFCDRLQFEAGVGAMSAKLKFEQSLGGNFVFRTHTNPLFFGGIRGVIFRRGQRGISADVKVVGAMLDVRSISRNQHPLHANGATLSTLEGQMALSVFYLLGPMVPYLGIKGSQSCFEFKKLRSVRPYIMSKKRRLTNRRKMDFILGVGGTECAILGLNAEVRLLDDRAITLTGELRF